MNKAEAYVRLDGGPTVAVQQHDTLSFEDQIDDRRDRIRAAWRLLRRGRLRATIGSVHLTGERRYWCFTHNRVAVWGGAMWYPWCDEATRTFCDTGPEDDVGPVIAFDHVRLDVE